jgi:hypothetical protein
VKQLREAAVDGEDACEQRHEDVERVQRRTAVRARMEIALARPHFDVEVERPARRDREHRRLVVQHGGVEDHAGACRTGCLLEMPEDRRAADLLLAVEQEPDVDGKLARRREVQGCAGERPQLPLVVGDAARVQPAVAHFGRERLAVPQLVRRRRLDVEMPVTQDERRSGCAAPHERVDDRPACALDDVGVGSGSAKQRCEPVRGRANVGGMTGVGADRGDAQQLAQLRELRF